MRKKLRSARGVTLIEMTAAVLVLMLLVLMLHSGLLLAAKSYRKMNAQAETKLLMSTIMDVLAEEMRYARDIQAGGDGTLRSYTSVSYGRNTELSVSPEGQLLANGKRMIATGAYGNGDYSISELQITYEDKIFTIRLRVEDEAAVGTVQELSVRCLNAR